MCVQWPLAARFAAGSPCALPLTRQIFGFVGGSASLFVYARRVASISIHTKKTKIKSMLGLEGVYITDYIFEHTGYFLNNLFFNESKQK